jgi:hypothetical protein
MTLDPAASLALAERVATIARQLGVESALIGAAALAVHRYTRGTQDIDLAVAVLPHVQLVELARQLDAAGLRTSLRLPDDDDPLGGVLSVRSAQGDDSDDVVEVVNFLNPGNPSPARVAAAIARAEPLPDSPLRCVRIEDLVALKLYAGGFGDLADIVNLLARNPDVDVDALRATAAPFDTNGVLDRLIDEASIMRRQPGHADAQRRPGRSEGE